ncbi:MAG: S41 family peptidase [Pseudomonadota bacterium]
MPLKYRAILVVTVGLVLGLGLPLSAQWLQHKHSHRQSDLLREGELLAEVMERVKADYVDPVSDEMLLQSAVDGMIQALDAHSEFLDSDEYAEIRISSTGNYTGIGIEVTLDQGWLSVLAPFENTPAAEAGILPGDIIIQIDGEDVDPDRLSESVARLRGKVGSRVRLQLIRDGVDEPLLFTLRRSNVKVVSVRGELLNEGLAYVRISQFNEATANDVKRTIKRLRRLNEEALQGLVLDLRNNPGGVLDSAVQVSDLFLDDGVIVSARGRDNEETFVHSARSGDILQGKPISVLINQASASAAEIVAGALHDHDRATLVGATTYGKGSVQTVMPLSNGNAIKLTTSRYFTPDGVSIHGLGIAPDFEVPLDDEQTQLDLRASRALVEDVQLDRALKILRDPNIQHSKAP